MLKWSTTGVAQFVKLIMVPAFGLVMLLIEQQRDVPRELIVGAGLLLVGVGFPGGIIEAFLSSRRPPEPPAPPAQRTVAPGDGPAT